MAKEGEVIAVKAIKAVLGAEPHEALAVLQDGGDDALGKAFFEGVMIEVDVLSGE